MAEWFDNQETGGGLVHGIYNIGNNQTVQTSQQARPITVAVAEP